AGVCREPPTGRPPPPIGVRAADNRPLNRRLAMIKTPATPSTVVPAPNSAPVSRTIDSEPQLDAERLDVYRVALECQPQAAVLAGRGDSAIRDQLRRASLSVVLNIAEGAGARSRATKRQLYGIARGSAMECAAAIDVLRIRGLVPASDCRRARTLLARLGQTLTRPGQCLGA